MQCFKSSMLADRVSLTTEEFAAWVETAETGDRIEYHRGDLAGHVLLLSVAGRRDDPLSCLADLAREEFRRGRVHLAQQRVGCAGFSYIAIKRPPEARAW